MTLTETYEDSCLKFKISYRCLKVIWLCYFLLLMATTGIGYQHNSMMIKAFVLISTLICYVAESELFLVRPGDGEDFAYSPVGVNATLHCTVNNTNLFWVVDGLNFDREFSGAILHSRGIYQRLTTSQGIMRSELTVYGDMETNNIINVCCLSFLVLGENAQECCTTLLMYGKEQTLYYLK